MAKVAFTAGRVAAFKCPPDKAQAFLWDLTQTGLGLRVTPNGKPAYVFQGVYQGRDVRVTIGDTSAWSIPLAQAKARELQRLSDEGIDPRSLKRNAVAAAKAHEAEKSLQAAQDAREAVTVGEAWAVYLEARKPYWGELHYRDHVDKASPGGAVSKKHGQAKRGTKTKPGPLQAFMHLRLKDLDQAAIEAWAKREGATRPTSARLAKNLLCVFLNWCADHPDYAAVTPARNPANSKATREALGKAGAKNDALLKEQLPAWFAAVRAGGNPAHAAYLQTLLLTGARPGEVLELKWADLNTKWGGMTIRDKVEGERVIPLTPYVSQLLHALPRRNPWVFASPAPQKKGACMTKPNKQHDAACQVAGVEGLTLHGLRRSFKSLSEWLELPAGVVAQIMGHKPSATAEKHYTVRPLDLLRLHHERLEAWILEQANVPFTPNAKPGGLQVVNA